MRVLIALFLALAVGACAPTSTPTGPDGPAEPEPPSSAPTSDPEGQAMFAENRARWTAQRPDAYRFTYMRNCFCGQEYRGPFAVTVRGDGVTEVVYEGEGEPVEDALANASLTIEDLFGFIAEAYEREAFLVTAEYAETGQPTNVYVDYAAHMADEEMGFTIDPVHPVGE